MSSEKELELGEIIFYAIWMTNGHDIKDYKTCARGIVKKVITWHKQREVELLEDVYTIVECNVISDALEQIDKLINERMVGK